MRPLIAPAIERYTERHTSEATEVLNRLEEETRRVTAQPQMLSGRVEGQFLRLLVAVSGARRVLEVGMFTGYSALSMAEAIPDDGELLTCERNEESAAIAKRYFDESPHGKKIRVLMGNALETLETLHGPFDFAFLDADKENYPRYYERLVELVRPGGLIAVDNALWSGDVLSPEEAESTAIHQLNVRASTDDRVESVLLTVRDGVLLIRKKAR
jgi:caffeoyl-CoA O-methyltransferase